MSGGVLFLLLFVLLLAGMPVFAGIAATCAIFMQVTDIDFFMVIQRMYSGVDKMTLLALPGFLIAGNLMDQGGLAKRLVSFCELFVAKLPGGLPIVTVAASAIFGAISGSGVATTAVVGGIMLPEMKQRGYEPSYVGALITSGGVLDAVIPPSVILVVYGAATGTSIADLFKAGFSVGLFMMISVMILCIIQGRRQNITLVKKVYTKAMVLSTLKESILALLAPLLIIVGIFGGFVTPTECSVILIAYVILVCGPIFHELSLASIWESFKKAALQSAAILLILSTASVFGWIIAYTKLPNMLMNAILAITANKVLIVLAVNLVVLVAGMFMSGTAIVLIAAPILTVLCSTLQINPVHFGAMILMNLAIGCMTPPFGTCLYASSMVTKAPVEKIAVKIIPFLLVYFIDLVLLMLFPDIALIFV